MKYLFLGLILFSFVGLYGATTPSTADKFIEQDFDVISYDATVDLTKFPSKNISGFCDIILKWNTTEKTNEFYFHLRHLNIDSIFYNKSKTDIPILMTDIAGEGYYALPIALNTKFTDTIRVYYSGEMKSENNTKFNFGGVFFQDSILYSIGVGFCDKSVSALRYWLPCYDHCSDKALFNLKFIISDGLSVASNGILNDIQKINNGTEIWNWKTNTLAATYLINFALGKFSILGSPYQQNPIMVFCLKSDSLASTYAYQNVPLMLNFQKSIFGDYPFEKVGFVNTTIGSMEHQTMISMAKSVIKKAFQSKDQNNTTIFHEMSHQWFGNSITPIDFREVWLNEAFATYAEALWAEHLLGFKDGYIKNIKGNLANYLSIAQSEGYLPLFAFNRAKYSNYPRTIYDKGAVVLGLLRYELGEEEFFKFLKAYAKRFAYSNISTDEFTNFLSTFSGKDFSWFINQWVKSQGYPLLKIEVAKIPIGDNKFRLGSIAISQTQNPAIIPKYKNFPLPIKLMASDGSIVEEFIYRINQNDTTIYFNEKEYIFDKIAINESTQLVSLISLWRLIYTDISDENINDDFVFNPTITEGEAVLNWSGDFITLEIEIFDLNGKKVFCKEIVNGESLDIANFNTGIYIYKLSDKGNYIHFNKFIKK